MFRRFCWSGCASWWRVARRMLDGGGCSGMNPINPLTERQLKRHSESRHLAKIDKRVSMEHPTPQLYHAPAGAEGRHPRDPGAGSQKLEPPRFTQVATEVPAEK